MKSGLKELGNAAAKRHAELTRTAAGGTLVAVEVVRRFEQALSNFRILFVSLFILMLSLMPPDIYGFVPPVVMVAFIGSTYIREVTVNESGRALVMLPVSTRWFSSVLWALAVVLLPIVNGIIQFPIRVLLGLVETDKLRAVAWLPVECLVAMGLVGAVSLMWGARAGGHLATQATSSFRQQAGRSVVNLATLALLCCSVFMSREETRNGWLALTVAALSVWLVTTSYLLAAHAWGPAAISQRPVKEPFVFMSDLSRCRAGSFSFPRYWYSGAPRAIWNCLIMALGVILLHRYLAPLAILTPTESDTPRFDLAVVVIVLLPSIFGLFTAFIDPRTIRALPLTRRRQTALVFMLGAPYVAQTYAAALCWGWMSSWHWLVLISVVAAMTGLYMFTVAIIVAFGNVAVFPLVCVGSLPFGALGSAPPIVWPLVLIPVGLILANVAYAVLYDQLANGTALYHRRVGMSDIWGG